MMMHRVHAKCSSAIVDVLAVLQLHFAACEALKLVLRSKINHDSRLCDQSDSQPGSARYGYETDGASWHWLRVF